MIESTEKEECFPRCHHCGNRLDQDVFFTVQHVALRWKVNPKTLYNWRWEGIALKPVYICGRLLRFTVADIVAVERQRQKDDQP